MTRKRRPLLDTIVIVCEDSVLTPTYLRKLSAEVVGKGRWSDIRVFPLPAEETTAKNANPNKSPRHARPIMASEKGLVLEIEDQYRAQPVRYVREAQLRMLEDGYTEGWAVYDLDGHAAQQEAHALSLEEPKIGVAFSSIAIEHFFLLHFTRNNTAYPKSADVPLTEFMPAYEKTTNVAIELYNLTRPLLDIALENAGWLRTINTPKITGTTPFYSINPYVDMDLLMRSLYERHDEIRWSKIGEVFVIKNLRCIVEHPDTSWQVTVTNESPPAVTSSQIQVYSLDTQRQKQLYQVANSLVVPGTSHSWDIPLASAGLINVVFESIRFIVAT